MRAGSIVNVLPFELARSSNLAVTPGSNYLVATLPTGVRPTGTTLLGTGTTGVAGNLGASRWLVNGSGEVYYTPLVTGGTFAAGLSIQNHAAFGGGSFQL